MDAKNLIEALKARGLNFQVDGEQIKVLASREPDIETKALLNEVRHYKAEIIEALTKDDPILTREQWYPEFQRFHVEVVRRTPNLDWIWLRERQPELHRAIQGIEDRIDSLGNARLSVVMEIMTDWRALVQNAEFGRLETAFQGPDE